MLKELIPLTQRTHYIERERDRSMLIGLITMT